MNLDEAFADGSLVHPLVGAPNSVDLFVATAMLAGGPSLASSDNVKHLTEEIGHHDHYLFVLVDGLGMRFRDQFPQNGFFANHFHTRLNSVFPSTTAVALTSLATGTWPAQHGMTGWFTYFPEHQRVMAPLLFRERGTNMLGTDLGLAVVDMISEPALLGSFFRKVASVLPRSITDGLYAHWSRAGTPIIPFTHHGQARRSIRRIMRQATGPTYTYLYLISVDHLSHKHGVSSDEVTRDIAKVDRLLEQIRARLPESVRMVVTADHGLVDVPPERQFVFREGDPLAATLYAGQTGEGATPVFHVRDEDAFQKAFAEHPASEHFTLFRPSDLAERGLYGPVALSDRMQSHLGDFVGIAVEPSILQYVPAGSKPVNHVGVHGGLRPGEVEVPLFLA